MPHTEKCWSVNAVALGFGCNKFHTWMDLSTYWLEMVSVTHTKGGKSNVQAFLCWMLMVTPHFWGNVCNSTGKFPHRPALSGNSSQPDNSCCGPFFPINQMRWIIVSFSHIAQCHYVTDVENLTFQSFRRTAIKAVVSFKGCQKDTSRSWQQESIIQLADWLWMNENDLPSSLYQTEN